MANKKISELPDLSPVSGMELTPIAIGGVTYSAKVATLGPVIDVRSYGAVGNGIADDTIAIRNAILDIPATGGKLVFPAGTFLVNDTILFDTLNGFVVEGAGRGATTITATAPMESVLSFLDCSRFTVRDIDVNVPATIVVTNAVFQSISGLGHSSESSHFDSVIVTVARASSYADCTNGFAIGTDTTGDVAEATFTKCTVYNAVNGWTLGNGSPANVLDTDMFGCQAMRCDYGVYMAGSWVHWYGGAMVGNTAVDFYNAGQPPSMNLVIDGVRSESGMRFLESVFMGANSMAQINNCWVSHNDPLGQAIYWNCQAPLLVTNSTFSSFEATCATGTNFWLGSVVGPPLQFIMVNTICDNDDPTGGQHTSGSGGGRRDIILGGGYTAPGDVAYVGQYPNDAALRQGTFNVKDYGATGDGLTFDTAAIQAVFDACPDGGTILFPAGDYLINDKLYLYQRVGVNIKGTGRGTRIVSQANGVIDRSTMLELDGLFGCTVEDLWFTASPGLDAAPDYADGHFIRDVITLDWAHDGSTAVTGSQSSSANHFRNLFIDGTYSIGINVGSKTGNYQADITTFVNCTISGQNNQTMAVHGRSRTSALAGDTRGYDPVWWQRGISLGSHTYGNCVNYFLYGNSVAGFQKGVVTDIANAFVFGHDAGSSLIDFYVIGQVGTLNIDGFRTERSAQFLVVEPSATQGGQFPIEISNGWITESNRDTGNADRTFTDFVFNSTTTVTSATAAFVDSDIGKDFSGAGIPADTRIVDITSATTAILENATTTSGSGKTASISQYRTAASMVDGVYSRSAPAANPAGNASHEWRPALSPRPAGTTIDVNAGPVTLRNVVVTNPHLSSASILYTESWDAMPRRHSVSAIVDNCLILQALYGGGSAGVTPATAIRTANDVSLEVRGLQIVDNTINPTQTSISTWSSRDARTPYTTARTLTDGVFNSTTTVTSASAAFDTRDIGRDVTGANVPAGTYIASVESATSVTLSAATTASGSGKTFTISGHAITPNDRVLLGDATTAAFTARLPSAAVVGKGSRFTVKKTDASGNAITVATTLAQTIDGATTKSLPAQYDKITVVSDGANWAVI